MTSCYLGFICRKTNWVSTSNRCRAFPAQDAKTPYQRLAYLGIYSTSSNIKFPKPSFRSADHVKQSVPACGHVTCFSYFCQTYTSLFRYIYIYDYINMLYVYGGGTISRCPDRQQADRMLWKLWYTRNVRPGNTPAGKHIRSHLHWRIASRIVHHALDCRYRLTKTPYSSHSIHDYISKSEYLLFKIKNKTSVGQLLLIAQKLWYLND